MGAHDHHERGEHRPHDDDAPDPSGHGKPFTWDPTEAQRRASSGDGRWLMWLGLALLVAGAVVWWIGTH
jgi:hypothetical protein